MCVQVAVLHVCYRYRLDSVSSVVCSVSVVVYSERCEVVNSVDSTLEVVKSESSDELLSLSELSLTEAFAPFFNFAILDLESCFLCLEMLRRRYEPERESKLRRGCRLPRGLCRPLLL